MDENSNLGESSNVVDVGSHVGTLGDFLPFFSFFFFLSKRNQSKDSMSSKSSEMKETKFLEVFQLLKVFNSFYFLKIKDQKPLIVANQNKHKIIKDFDKFI